jgi:hypothetical protein
MEMSKTSKVKLLLTFFKYILGLVSTLAILYFLAFILSESLGLKQDITVPVMIILYIVLSPIVESFFTVLENNNDYKIEEPLEE